MSSSAVVPALRPAVLPLAASATVFAADAGLVADGHAGWLDHPALTEAVEHRDGVLTTVMTAVTNAAEIPLVVLAVLVALVLARRARSWRPVLLVGAAGALSVAAATVAKDLALRVRPPMSYWLVHESDYSFPSRHTTMTAALLPLLAVLITDRLAARGAKAGVWVAVVACTVLVGASRIYLGVHWATDVLGGLALGLTVALAVLTADRLLRRRTGQADSGTA